MLRVVVVDDEPAVARSLGRLLMTRGFEVRTCEGAASALKLLELSPADVVVSDFNMPEMDGLMLLAEVRRRWPAARRVLVSALAATLGEEQLAPCAPCALLAKPFTEAELLMAVEGAVS